MILNERDTNMYINTHSITDLNPCLENGLLEAYEPLVSDIHKQTGFFFHKQTMAYVRLIYLHSTKRNKNITNLISSPSMSMNFIYSRTSNFL